MTTHEGSAKLTVKVYVNPDTDQQEIRRLVYDDNSPVCHKLSRSCIQNIASFPASSWTQVQIVLERHPMSSVYGTKMTSIQANAQKSAKWSSGVITNRINWLCDVCR
ncbi:hypothetical protein P5673_013496 [Acropora cervicornis]|uniref:Uncharacterized protein n=1 Tax=Acropora cervicornis TaxID=6130 RepID=A0AAD9V6M7_ACRCE|nr:hypothetical protein P5673_013496 [Acropora cervicornis]